MKKFILLLCTILPLVFSSGCENGNNGGNGTEPPAKPKIEDYFPANENTHYIYEGWGNEYASYDVYVDYASDGKIQQRTDNGGTVMATVFEIKDGKLTKIFSRGEVYYRENFLNSKEGNEEIILMEPLEEGTTWTLADSSVRTITGTSVKVDTPSGSYEAIEVTTESPYDTIKAYYAKDVGMVKSVFESEGTEVSSTLKKIEKDVPFKQRLSFYYPNIDDNRIYYREREISFMTNDVTRNVLAEAYKESAPEGTGKVVSANTKINSLYLNKDGMVYIDLSRDFLSEMNAGAGYESMILDSIAATFGRYYNAQRVILTIDGGLYESGHIALQKGEYLEANYEDAVEVK